jgi:ABC-type amino acid transport substrate-binding protein
MRALAFHTMILPLVLAAGLLLAACGGGDASTPAPEPERTDVLTACTSVPFEPAAFREEGELVGYDVDVMEAIGQRLDRQVEWVEVEFDQVLDALEAGDCDVVIASMSITAERRERAAFVPYLTGTRAVKDAPEGPDAEVPDPTAPPLGIATRIDDELGEAIESTVDAMYEDGTMRSLLEQWGAQEFLLERGPVVGDRAVEP